jgi:hypothetical protein
MTAPMADTARARAASRPPNRFARFTLEVGAFFFAYAIMPPP